MIGKWKESVDNGGEFGTQRYCTFVPLPFSPLLMTDLSKAFDCLHHELLIAKLNVYGFDIKSVKLIQQYL